MEDALQKNIKKKAKVKKDKNSKREIKQEN